MRKILRVPIFVGLLLVLFLRCNREIIPSPANDNIETDQYILEPHTVNVSTNLPGFYSAVPGHYYRNNLMYPLLIYIHGAGQFGNGIRPSLDDVFKEGTPKLLQNKTFPLNFVSGGRHFTFIVLMPQFSRAFTTADMKAFYDYGVSHYRVDPTRIYITGFSLGGLMTSEFGSAYPINLAAMIPMAGETTTDLITKGRNIARNKLAVWVFHNNGDQVYDVNGARNFVAAINAQSPSIPAKLTVLSPQGVENHDAWTRACDPTYKENGMNIYEWMLQYTR